VRFARSITESKGVLARSWRPWEAAAASSVSESGAYLTDACLASLEAAPAERDVGGPLREGGGFRRLVLVDWVSFSYSTEVLRGTIVRELDAHESLGFKAMAA
jgi:hypothetical protein